jgi:hypothetical protein
LSFILNIFSSIYVTALADDKVARLYTTREEKREAGIKHRITPWLIASGLAEFEWNWERLNLDNTDKGNISRDTAANVQVSFFITPFDWIKSEIITEYDADINQFRIDEAELAFEYNSWELAIGKLFLPFGNYISHFANGPIIEFGETSDYTATLTYNYKDKLDISVSAYRSRGRQINSDNRLDWSAGIEAWPTDDLSFGISFITDLADSDVRLLADNNNRYENKVPAISGYLLWVSENYEISLEALGALESFRELDRDRDQPWAFNLEFAHFLTPKMDWAFRIEGSQELEDAPELQLGIAVNYRLYQNVALTVEALHGYFKDTIATDHNGKSYDTVDTLGAQISIGF